MSVRRGSERPGAVLTEDNVRLIRRLYGSQCECCGSRITGAILAERFGVSHVLVHKVVKRIVWQHVADDPERKEP